MRAIKTWVVVAVLAVVAVGSTSCTNDALDDGSGPDVILEVLTLENPAIEGQLDAGVCTLTINDWSATLLAAPKNTVATPPFNDIVMVDVVIAYEWLDPALTTPTRTFGLGNVVIPASTSSNVTFPPIALDDITPDKIGRTANLLLTFRARTVEGTTITDTAARPLSITCVASGGGGGGP